MYGMTNPPLIKPLLSSFSPKCHTWLTIRNDDIYSFRWGDIQFARDFIRCLPGPDKVAGFYMGPDGYCWGREAMDLEPESPRRLVMQKHWFSFMLWGRLSYEPALPDELFKRTVATRFPEVSAAELLAAWTAASRVIPGITPPFMKGVALAGWHLHFLTADRQGGGHVLEFTTQDAIMKADECREFHWLIPNSDDFRHTDFTTPWKQTKTAEEKIC